MTIHVGILRALSLAKQSALGTINTTPEIYMRYIPPETFSSQITTLESAGIQSIADKVTKATRGPAEIKGAKFKVEVEPENLGQILLACFGADVVTGTALLGYTHTFKRASVAQLPVYTVWVDSGNKYKQFVDVMLHKLDLEIKAKDFITADTEWVGRAYDDNGVAESPTYSAFKPFAFNQAVVKINGVQSNDYDNLKFSMDNFTMAEHALNNDIYTAKIWSEGFRTEISADLYFEDAVEYNKFLAGTTSHFNVEITGDEDITNATAGTKAKLILDAPVLRYRTAPLNNPAGILKIPFTGVAVYSPSDGYSVSAAYKNSKVTAY